MLLHRTVSFGKQLQSEFGQFVQNVKTKNKQIAKHC